MESKPNLRKTYAVVLAALYGIVTLCIISEHHTLVSISYVFILPLLIGTIPVLFSTREQMLSFKSLILIPWGSIFLFVLLAFALKLEGIICLVIIVAPFILLGTLAAFVVQLVRQHYKGPKTPLYSSLLLPLIIMVAEQNMTPADAFHTVTTTLEVNAPQATVWQHVKHVKDVRPEEIQTHFTHLIHVPKPLHGYLDKEGADATRSISWDKGIQFRFDIQEWHEGEGFTYRVNLDGHSIPPNTLDEHVMVGGAFFDVVSGSYRIKALSPAKSLLTLTSTYRVTTTFNFYCIWWADFLMDDLHEMILEIIKTRSEKAPHLSSRRLCAAG
ncbi:SRPBCC family protein [Rufibacter ruber]|uniref:SRPBCC family protein n=1 Tax=Rufibacter ruber TaxID=1783499 RepID=UPI000833C3AB|nr:SRPBCC family protein [Rufibacter ruber]